MGNRLSAIATRTGDDGTTGLGDGTRVPKDSARIRALGDPDEDAALIFGTEAGAEHDFEGSAGVPAVGSLARRLALMRLVLAWSRTLRAEEIRDIHGFGPLVATPAQASYLAADLARLMDFIESEEVDLAALEGLMPDEYAEHWQLTLDFLDIVTEHWPQHLRDQGLVSPVARRNALMAMEATRLQTHGSRGPVIAAGSTGTVPATARLLKTIASLPNGAVVLPGLDLSLDAASWKSLGEHPEHPQFALAQLLAMLGVEREEVAYVPGSARWSACGASTPMPSAPRSSTSGRSVTSARAA